MKYMTLALLMVLALSGCKEGEGLRGETGPQGPQGERGAAASVDSGSQRDCFKVISIGTFTNVGIRFRKIEYASGDVAVTCWAGYKTFLPSGFQLTPAGESQVACEAYWDASPTSVTANFGRWVFNATNESVTYRQNGSALDNTQFTFAAGDCQ